MGSACVPEVCGQPMGRGLLNGALLGVLGGSSWLEKLPPDESVEGADFKERVFETGVIVVIPDLDEKSSEKTEWKGAVVPGGMGSLPPVPEWEEEAEALVEEVEVPGDFQGSESVNDAFLESSPGDHFIKGGWQVGYGMGAVPSARGSSGEESGREWGYLHEGGLRVAAFEQSLRQLSDEPGGWCAAGTVASVEALTGQRVTMALSAKDCGRGLLETGVYEWAREEDGFRDFDVRVLQPSTATGPHGHMEIYYKGKWYSDHRQARSGWESGAFSSQALYRLKLEAFGAKRVGCTFLSGS